MVLDERGSNDSYSSGERAAASVASPAYEGPSGGFHLPPMYQSQANLADDSIMGSSQEKGKQRSPPDSFGSEDAVRPAPRATMTPKGPRIAVTDPLADFRAGATERPQGLGSRSDWPPTFKFNDEVFDGREVRPTHSRRDSDASSLTDGGGDYFDEFDWSEDEEEQKAVQIEEKRANAIAMRHRRISPFKVFKWLGSTFLGNFVVSAALVVPVIVLQYTYRNKGPRTGPEADHRDYVADNVQAWFIWAAFNLHVEWWIHFIVELFPRMMTGILALFWGNVSQSAISFVEIFNAIKPYIKLVFYAALSWGSWAIIFTGIYGLYLHDDPKQSRAAYLYRIYQVVEFFFFFILTLCAEKIVIKIISINFHQTAYADRINRITRALKVFDHLKDNRPKTAEKGFASPFGLRTPHLPRTPIGGRTPTTNKEGQVSAQLLAAELERTGQRSGQATPKSGTFPRKTHAAKRAFDSNGLAPPSMQDYADPATPGAASARSTRSKRTIQAARQKASQATALARRAMIDPTHLLTDETVGVGLDVNSPAEARRLARTIFRAYRGRHHRTYLIPSDFHCAYPTHAEAKEAFEVFDTDRNGDISVTEMKNTIVEIYKERRFVAKSLEDTSSALSQLDLIFIGIAMIIVAFEAFAIFKIDVSKTITTFYTLAIGASFVFKESAQEVFDSIIFLFVTHPFDTGDRIVVDGSVMVVQKMNLLSCQFLLWDNTQLFINNALLCQMFITNYRRSGYQWECVTIQVAFDTPLPALDAVQADLIHWLQTEPERMFEPSTALVPQTIDYMRSITITIGMTHRANYQDWGARWYRRNCFFSAVCYYMRKHGVRFMNSTQPIIVWDPPSYEASQNQRAPGSIRGSGESLRRRGSDGSILVDEEALDDAQSVNEAGDDRDRNDPDIVLNDDFSAGRPAQAGISALSGTATPGAKGRAFMGFSPPPDEIEGTALRRRKARQSRKGLMQQGGEGGGG